MEVSPDPISSGEEFELHIQGEAIIGPDFVLKVIEDEGPVARYRLASVDDSASVPVSSITGDFVEGRLAMEVKIDEGSTWSVTLTMPTDLAGEEIEICALPAPCGRFSVR